MSVEATAPWIIPPSSLLIIGLDVIGPPILLGLVVSTLVLGSVGVVVIILRPSHIIVIITSVIIITLIIWPIIVFIILIYIIIIITSVIPKVRVVVIISVLVIVISFTAPIIVTLVFVILEQCCHGLDSFYLPPIVVIVLLPPHSDMLAW